LLLKHFFKTLHVGTSLLLQGDSFIFFDIDLFAWLDHFMVAFQGFIVHQYFFNNIPLLLPHHNH